MAGDARIYHLTTRAEWDEALADGHYQRSTRGLSLADVGFIHASTAEQLEPTALRFYADVDDELVVLVISLDTLATAGIEVRCEDGCTGEHYPHVYASLPCALVEEVRPYVIPTNRRQP
jgi:glutathione S-transferase